MKHNQEYGLKVGDELTRSFMVKDEDSALYIGSGDLNVLGTPALAKYMEQVAKDFLKPFLPHDSLSTVGTSLHIEHTAAALLNENIDCTAKLVEFDEKKYIFEIKVSCQDKTLGTARHIRHLVNKEKFMSKLSHGTVG